MSAVSAGNERRPRRNDAFLIDRAGQLVRYCAAYLSDVDAGSKGWKVYYAMDADIVGLYLDPYYNAHYAGIFEDCDSLLARLIGDYLLKDFSTGPGNGGKGQLFIVPPHDDEIARMIMKVTARAVHGLDNAEELFDQFTRELGPKLHDLKDRPAVTAWLIDKAATLIEFFDGGSGALSELSRFLALGQDRLLNVEHYVEKDPVTGPWAFPLPDTTGRSQDMDEFSGLVDKWQTSLKRHRSRKQRARNLDEDAQALARIEWLNARMVEEKRKIVLVTGTSSIWGAARAEENRIQQGLYAGKTFADAYIRHPQAFMAKQDFFFKPDALKPGTVFNVIEWLNLVFPNVVRRGASGTALADVRKLPQTHAGNGGLHHGHHGGLVVSEDSSVVAEWNTQVRAAAVARHIDPDEEFSDRANRLVEWMSQQMQGGWTVEQLRSDVCIRAVHSLSNLYASTVWLSLWDRVKSLPEHARGIPALRFEHPYEVANEYCQVVVNAMQAKADSASHSKKVALDLEHIHTMLAQLEPHHYLSNVIHALAYATKGHWYATQTLCRIALRIIDSLAPEQRKTLKGREASFLLAVAERRQAQKVEALDQAAQWLKEARTRLELGRDKDMRFESEDLAQAIARLNFSRFVGPCKPDQVLKQARELMERATELLMLSLDVRITPEPHVRDWVGQQVLTNLFNVSLIARELAPGHPQAEALVRRALDCLRDMPSCASAMKDDQVAHFIHTAAAAVFAEERSTRAEARLRLKELPFPLARPFDREREALFRRLAAGAEH